jgi:hypothetical protein
VAAAYSDFYLVKHVLFPDHLPGAVGGLDGGDVDDGSSHQEGGGGDDHGDGAADMQL